MIDSQVIQKRDKVRQDGHMISNLKVPKELSYGQHIVKIIQKANRSSVTPSESFVKSVMDND